MIDGDDDGDENVYFENDNSDNDDFNSLQDAMGHAIGDWDNDGYLDWFSSAIWHNRTECSESGCTFDNKGNVLFRNLGGRRFEDATHQVTLLHYRVVALSSHDC